MGFFESLKRKPKIPASPMEDTGKEIHGHAVTTANQEAFSPEEQAWFAKGDKPEREEAEAIARRNEFVKNNPETAEFRDLVARREEIAKELRGLEGVKGFVQKFFFRRHEELQRESDAIEAKLKTHHGRRMQEELVKNELSGSRDHKAILERIVSEMDTEVKAEMAEEAAEQDGWEEIINIGEVRPAELLPERGKYISAKQEMYSWLAANCPARQTERVMQAVKASRSMTEEIALIKKILPQLPDKTGIAKNFGEAYLRKYEQAGLDLNQALAAQAEAKKILTAIAERPQTVDLPEERRSLLQTLSQHGGLILGAAAIIGLFVAIERSMPSLAEWNSGIQSASAIFSEQDAIKAHLAGTEDAENK